MLLPHSNAVEIWVVSLDPGVESGRLAAVLSCDELARAARIPDERLRRRYIAGRFALRHLLAGRLAVDPEELCFAYGEHGKPSLVGVRMSFNLSHSGDLALIAIAGDSQVGVDLERVRPRPRLDLLARRMLTGSEQELFERAQRRGSGNRCFLRYWTAKEAVGKALGLGLTLAPSRINLIPDGDETALAEIAPAANAALPRGAKSLRVQWLSGLNGAVGALAGGSVPLRVGRWHRFSYSARPKILTPHYKNVLDC